MTYITNHESMFRAFLAGKTLVGKKGEELKLVNKNIVATDSCGNRVEHEYPVEYWSIKVYEPNSINGHLIPEAQKEPLAVGVRYYCPSLQGVSTYSWTGDKADYSRLHKRIIHLTRALAKLHNEAALSLANNITQNLVSMGEL